MLCPEVWDFKSPKHHFTIENRDYKKTDIPTAIKTHYFNHSVSLILPDTGTVPSNVQNCLLDDTDYYKISELDPSDLINKEFIEAFVKKGQFTLHTIGNKIDLHNSIAVTPTGNLILSIIAEDFQRLGIEGKASFFDRKVHTRFIVTIDLNAESFTPGKKNYEHTKKCLEERLGQRFDVILSWDPHEENVCPSSVAAWFHEQGYIVSQCQQKFVKRTEYSVKIPTLDEGYDIHQFCEWLGVLAVSGDLRNGKTDNYVNTFVCPSSSIEVGQVQYLQWTGFYTSNQIERMYNIIKEYLLSRSTIPWCCIHIQGFTDSPVSWDLKEHTYFTDGDNSCTLIIQPNANIVIRKSLSSNNKQRIFQ